MLSMKKFFREPLLHFLILGSLLFIVYQFVPTTNTSTTFVVSEQRIQILSKLFQATWHRGPTNKELNALIDNYILEELYYREALLLGLDQDDPVIRRRLQQKMEFISNDLSSLIDATDAELDLFLAKNIDQYRGESIYSFKQIYIDPMKHDDPNSLAQQWLASIKTLTPIGDSTMLPTVVVLKNQREISSSFGTKFAAHVANTKPHLWSGPITSSFGLHLTYISDVQHAKAPSLIQVRDKVNRDWAYQQQQQIQLAMDAKLRQKYNVSVENLNYVQN